MANAKDITIEDIQLTILTYGPSGTGKTRRLRVRLGRLARFMLLTSTREC